MNNLTQGKIIHWRPLTAKIPAIRIKVTLQSHAFLGIGVLNSCKLGFGIK